MQKHDTGDMVSRKPHGFHEANISWKSYFRDPLQWFVNRKTMGSAPYNCSRPASEFSLFQPVDSRFSDLRHKITKEPLYVDDRLNPSWVSEEMKRRNMTSVNVFCPGKETSNKTVACCQKTKEAIAYVALIKDCATNKDMQKGSNVHVTMLGKGLVERNPFVGSALISMYAKCGALMKAQHVHDELLVRDVVSWNALIAGYAQCGRGEEALNCFEQMLCDKVSPDVVTFTSVLKACGCTKAIEKGKQIHKEIISKGLLGKDAVLGTALVDMYAKCGELEKAQEVFDELPVRCVVSWSALMGGYAQEGKGEMALHCFENMQKDGYYPNAITYACALKACGIIQSVEKGQQLHNEIVKKRLLDKDILLGTALVDTYAKCGELEKAQKVFEGLPVQCIASWNALIAGHVQQGQGEDALSLFEQMKNDGVTPNVITFTCILKACGCRGLIEKGEQIHHEIISQGLMEKHTVLGDALVGMYAKCKMLTKAQELLDGIPVQTTASWNAIISGYVQQGQGEAVFHCYKQMQENGVSPDVITLAFILNACSSTGAVEKGKQFHYEILSKRLHEKHIILGNALVDMFVKYGEIRKAQEVFDALPMHDVVSWNSLIGGYAQNGQAEEALYCFERMQRDNIPADAITFICALKACGNIGAFNVGKRIHDQIVSNGLIWRDTILGTAVVDMYAKCGDPAKAKEVFDKFILRNVASWNALMSGYAERGQYIEALDCFRQMEVDGFSPDAVTFLSVLTACSHSCLVEEGENHFENMSRRYGIIPNCQHCTCMVDLFGNAGLFGKAMSVIKKMPFSYYPVWFALLNACQKWGNVKLGRLAFEEAIRFDGNNAAVYACMAQIYAMVGMHEGVKEIEAMRTKMKARNLG